MSEETGRGPVDLAVIEFPGSRFDGRIAPALRELVDAGIIAILDIVLVTKNEDGSIEGMELVDLDEESRSPFADLDGEVGGLLSDADLQRVGEPLDPGSTVVLIVWENRWARRLAGAIGAVGGRLVAHERLPADSVDVALSQSDIG